MAKETRYKEFDSGKNLYLIGDNGEVIRKTTFFKNATSSGIKETNTKLNGYLNKNGYRLVELNGRGYLVHRLVAMCFVEKTKGKEFVNHIDGNKLNNNADNLEWVTHKENIQHSYKLGLHYNDFGEKARNFKYKFKCVEHEEWGELTALKMAEKINSCVGLVTNFKACAKNITYRGSAYGLTFIKTNVKESE